MPGSTPNMEARSLRAGGLGEDEFDGGLGGADDDDLGPVLDCGDGPGEVGLGSY